MRNFLWLMTCFSFLGLTACEVPKLSSSSGGGGGTNIVNNADPFAAPDGARVWVDGHRVQAFEAIPMPRLSLPQAYVSRLALYTNDTGKAAIGDDVIAFPYTLGRLDYETDYSEVCGEGSQGGEESYGLSYDRPEGHFTGSIYIVDGNCERSPLPPIDVTVVAPSSQTSCFLISGSVTTVLEPPALEDGNSNDEPIIALPPSYFVQEYFEMSPGGCDNMILRFADN